MIGRGEGPSNGGRVSHGGRRESKARGQIANFPCKVRKVFQSKRTGNNKKNKKKKKNPSDLIRGGCSIADQIRGKKGARAEKVTFPRVTTIIALGDDGERGGVKTGKRKRRENKSARDASSNEPLLPTALQ